MRRIISLILICTMSMALTACGSNTPTSVSSSDEGDKSASSVSEPKTTSEPEVTSESEAPLQQEADATSEASAVSAEDVEAETETLEMISDEDMAELEALGNIEVENGILTVTITVPADYVGEEITQEELDADVGEIYQKATLNDDGSVTYKMTKAQHANMLTSIREGMAESIQEMIDDDETFSISDITYNDDFTEINVYEDGEEMGFADAFAVYALFITGGMYGVFTGKQPDNIAVNYYDSNGNLLETFNSSEMEE